MTNQTYSPTEAELVALQAEVQAIREREIMDAFLREGMDAECVEHTFDPTRRMDDIITCDTCGSRP